MLRKSLPEGVGVDDIARLVNGTLIGNPEVRVFSLMPLEQVEPQSLSFTKKVSAKALRKTLDEKPLAALLISQQVDTNDIGPSPCPLISVADPLRAVIQLIPLFFDRLWPTPEISPKADIDPSALLGEDVYVGPFVTIGAGAEISDQAVIYPHATIYPYARIGKRAVIHAHAVIREACQIGDDVVIQNGAVIGADGFGYLPDSKLGLVAVPQVGNTCLAERVEVGANSCIDRATLGATTVGSGTKIDNLVQVGHNTTIGSDCILCGMVGVSGSTQIGNRVVLGGNVGVADHLIISDQIRVGAKAGVTSNLTERGDYAGHPAIPAREWHRQRTCLQKLPELLSRFKK